MIPALIKAHKHVYTCTCIKMYSVGRVVYLAVQLVVCVESGYGRGDGFIYGRVGRALNE